MAVDTTIQPSTWVEWVEANLPASYTSSEQRQFFSVCLGLVADALMQFLHEGAQLSFTKRSFNPNDVLRFVGDARVITPVESETPDQYRARILDCWNTHPYGGAEIAIQRQVELIGIDHCLASPLLVDKATYPGDSYQFSVACYVADPDPDNVLAAHYGDGPVYGSGIIYGGRLSQIVRSSQVRSIRRLVRTFKAVDWVCRQIFIITGPSDPLTDATTFANIAALGGTYDVETFDAFVG